MWSPSQRLQICLILVACIGSDSCAAQGFGPRTLAFTNSTTTSTKSSSSSLSSVSSVSSSSSHSSSTSPSVSSSSTHAVVNELIINKGSNSTTPTATLITSASSTQNSSSTITPGPAWGNQSIPLNTCSDLVSGTPQWTPCALVAGTVQMSFFPDNSGNITYPSTFYDPNFGVTMTSPSVYMMLNTITGYNDCGPLGPTFTNAVVSMDLTDCLTYQDYADHTVTTRMGPPQMLTLSDITSNCLNTYSSFSTDGAFINTHPVYGNYNRCRPRFVFPIQYKRIGYPYWMHCGPVDYEYGTFDPPGAVPPVVGLLPTTVAAPVTTTYDSASALPTAASDQAASTSTPPAPPAAPTSEAAPPPPPPADPTTAADPPPSAPTTPVDPPAPVDPTTPAPPDPASTPSPANPSIPATPVTTADPASTPADPSTPNDPASSPKPDPPVVTPTIPIPTSATAIATVGSHTISAIPGSSGVVLPGGSTATAGDVATLTDSNSHSIVVSVGSSGIFIGGTSSGDSTSFFSNPTIPPVAIATVGTQVVSAAPGATNIVVGSQTAALGSGSITVGSSIIQLSPSGVIVHDGSGGSTSTIGIPTLEDISATIPTKPIATVAGQTISAAAGATKVVVGSQTASLGGAPITVGSSVVELTPSGVVVHDGSGGPSSTFALPTAVAVAPMAPQVIATVAGHIISAATGATNVVVGSQTASLGGAPITVGSSIIKLTPSGVVVNDLTGGAASTFVIPTAIPEVSTPAPIATIGGQVISAAAGASTVVIQGQTITAGGDLVTLSGSNNVASLGSSGLVIQYSDGIVSSFALPTAAPSVGGIVGTVAGYSISASAGAPIIIIGNQTVTAGGAPVTVSDQVISLGPSGVAIQLPGGGVTTITPQSSAAVVSTSTSSSGGLASIIASFAGASQTSAKKSTSANVGIVSTGSPTGTSAPPEQSKSGAGANSVVWSIVGLCIVFATVLVE